MSGATAAGEHAVNARFYQPASALRDYFAHYVLIEIDCAEGEALIARGRVRKAGRTLTVTEAEVFARRDGAETPVAVMLATMMALHGRSDGPKETRA